MKYCKKSVHYSTLSAVDLQPSRQFQLTIINRNIAFLSQTVVDESDGCGGKFNAVIVSPQFEGKSILQRHRLVNAALADELKTIHAFSQKTFTPDQWALEQAKQ